MRCAHIAGCKTSAALAPQNARHAVGRDRVACANVSRPLESTSYSFLIASELFRKEKNDDITLPADASFHAAPRLHFPKMFLLGGALPGL
ncbi:MAG: hypothetical protein ACPIOQ_17055 [Promethearchaeia archaeon]